MTTAQLVSIIVAIVCGDGIWRIIENRLSRRDHLTDRKHIDVKELEEDLQKCAKACLRLLAHNLYSWQESVMTREGRTVGINEYKVMDGQFESYTNFGGNGIVKSRQEWIHENCEQVPDAIIDNVTERRES